MKPPEFRMDPVSGVHLCEFCGRQPPHGMYDAGVSCDCPEADAAWEAFIAEREAALNAKRCDHCRFFGSNGSCRRHPPVLVDARAGESAWPLVGAEDWCGEFQNKYKTEKNA